LRRGCIKSDTERKFAVEKDIQPVRIALLG